MLIVYLPFISLPAALLLHLLHGFLGKALQFGRKDALLFLVGFDARAEKIPDRRAVRARDLDGCHVLFSEFVRGPKHPAAVEEVEQGLDNMDGLISSLEAVDLIPAFKGDFDRGFRDGSVVAVDQLPRIVVQVADRGFVLVNGVLFRFLCGRFLLPCMPCCVYSARNLFLSSVRN